MTQQSDRWGLSLSSSSSLRSSLLEILSLLNYSSCQTWTLSKQLKKVATRVPAYQPKLENYAERIAEISSSLMPCYWLLSKKSHLLLKSKQSAHLGQHVFFNLAQCRFLLGPFSAVCVILGIHTGTWKRGKKPNGLEGAWFSTQLLDPFETATYSLLDEALAKFELYFGQFLAYAKEVLRLDPSPLIPTDLKNDELSKLGHALQLMMVKAEGQICKFESRHGHTSAADCEAFYSVQVQTKTILFVGGHQQQLNIPSFDSLNLWFSSEYVMGPLIPCNFHGDELLSTLVLSAHTMAARILSQPATSRVPEFSENWWQLHAHLCGRILLQDDIIVSFDCGRPKEKRVLLFENRLCFCRCKGSDGKISYDIRAEDMVLLTYRFTGPDSAALTIYWHHNHENSESPQEITSAELYFTNLYKLYLWAGFLATAIGLNERGWPTRLKRVGHLLTRTKTQKEHSKIQGSSLESIQLSDVIVPQKSKDRSHKKWRPLTRRLLRYHWQGDISFRVISLSNTLTVELCHGQMEVVDLEVNFTKLIHKRPILKHWLFQMMTIEYLQILSSSYKLPSGDNEPHVIFNINVDTTHLREGADLYSRPLYAAIHRVTTFVITPLLGAISELDKGPVDRFDIAAAMKLQIFGMEELDPLEEAVANLFSDY